jgi:hypothetical protein
MRVLSPQWAIGGLERKGTPWLVCPSIWSAVHTWKDKDHEDFYQSMVLVSLNQLVVHVSLNMPYSNPGVHDYLLLIQLEDPESSEEDPKDEVVLGSCLVAWEIA